MSSQDQYEPIYGDEIVRAQLELQMADRFSSHYNPTLVFLDGEWHYPITSETTFCGEAIPDPVIAVRNSQFSGPSTMGCSTCDPHVGGVTKRSLKRQIAKYLESSMNRSGTFPREGLEEILMALEDRHRRELESPKEDKGEVPDDG